MPDRNAIQEPVDLLGASPSCAVLVSSCDAYRDLWKPFFTLFWRYWPDCPFPVYLGSNSATYQDDRVTTLNTVEESWSKNLRWFLQQIDSSYILFLLDDFFLDRSVETVKLLQHLAALHALEGTALRLYPRPGPDLPIDGSQTIGQIHRLAPYRVSAQPAFWNRSKLLSLLRPNETPWEFEANGTLRSQSSDDGFYATYSPLLSYRHVVERGEWFWSAARKYETEFIGCDFQARPVMGPLKAVKKSVNRLRKDLLNSVLPQALKIRV
jgi:hypothetical protein